MPRVIPKPYLIEKDEAGAFRLTVRAVRFNSQGFPLVTENPVAEIFRSMAAARSHARAHFGAEAGQFATK